MEISKPVHQSLLSLKAFFASLSSQNSLPDTKQTKNANFRKLSQGSASWNRSGIDLIVEYRIWSLGTFDRHTFLGHWTSGFWHRTGGSRYHIHYTLSLADQQMASCSNTSPDPRSHHLVLSFYLVRLPPIEGRQQKASGFVMLQK